MTDAIRLLLYDGRTISDAAAQRRVVVNKERHYGADCGRTLWCFALEKDTTGVSLICTFLFVFSFSLFLFFFGTGVYSLFIYVLRSSSSSGRIAFSRITVSSCDCLPKPSVSP